MKKLSFIFLLFLSGLSNGQQTAPLKEAFDDYLDKKYTTGSIDYSVAANRPCCWKAWGDILSAYLNMYKTTGDKAYLNKFVKHTYGILGYNNSTNTYPYFWDFSSYGSCPGAGSTSVETQEVMSFHYTGRLLKPMAEFVYLVKQVYPALQNESILTSLGVPYTTYDNFANYVKGKVEASLDYSIVAHYYVSLHRYSKRKIPNYTICEINQAAGWGCAMLYAGKVNTTAVYTTVGIDMTNFLKSELTLYAPNSSYTWFHNSGASGNVYREDVSHGATDLSLAMVGYELYGNGLWTTQQLNYFAHTFTYNIWDRVNGRFTNNVFGMLTGNDTSQATCGINIEGTPNFWGPGEILAWMPIYQWDDAGAGSNGVYDLLLNQGANLLDGSGALVPTGYCQNTCNLSGTQSLEGITQVVRAQWREECVNLTLRNRDLNYNQDFNVKNKLVIDPGSQGAYCLTASQNYPNSFADPVISTDAFIIEPGVISNMVAGESITLLPGFSAKQGSQVQMYIEPGTCTDGMRPPNPSSGVDISNLSDENKRAIKSIELQTEKSESEEEVKAFKIFPNPGRDLVYISFTMPAEKIITVEITNLYGQKVSTEMNNQQITKGNYVIPFDGSLLEKGIYLCNLYLNGQLYKTEKIILSH